MRKAFQSFQNRSLKRTSPRTSEDAATSSVPVAGLGDVGAFFSKVVTPMWKKAADTISPRVVVGETRDSKSWATVNGVITGLTQYERVALNAMEERVLPPDVRIKIVVAQANVGDDEEEMEHEVKRLDGMVRTLALYGLLERNALENSRLHNISPERTRELGKMLVAAVQLELFLMLDDICEAGDVENELFDDLCCDTIQDGARDGFVNLTVELLISPGSGYKRLLQIRKDQLVEIIADVAGLHTLAGHDIHSPASESPFRGRPSGGVHDSDCDSPAGAAAPVDVSTAAGGGGGRLTPRTTTRARSRSVSPLAQHHRTQTERMRDLLSSIDGLVTNMEQSTEQASLSALVDLPPLSPEGLQWRQSGSLGPMDSVSVRSGRSVVSGAMGGTGSRLAPEDRDGYSSPPHSSTHNGSMDEEKLHSDHDSVDKSLKRAFFPDESDQMQPCSDPIALAEGRSPMPPLVGDTSSRTLLLSEVDWLIAGTRAALGEDPDVDLQAGDYAEDDTDAETDLEPTPEESDTAPDGEDTVKRESLPDVTSTLWFECASREPARVGEREGASSVSSATSREEARAQARDGEGKGVPSIASTLPKEEAKSESGASESRVRHLDAPGADDNDADDGSGEEWRELTDRAAARSRLSLIKLSPDRSARTRTAVSQVGSRVPKLADGPSAGIDGIADSEHVIAAGHTGMKAVSHTGDRRATVSPLSSVARGRGQQDVQEELSPHTVALAATGFKEVKLGPGMMTGDIRTSNEDLDGECLETAAGDVAVVRSHEVGAASAQASFSMPESRTRSDRPTQRVNRARDIPRVQGEYRDVRPTSVGTAVQLGVHGKGHLSESRTDVGKSRKSSRNISGHSVDGEEYSLREPSADKSEEIGSNDNGFISTAMEANVVPISAPAACDETVGLESILVADSAGVSGEQLEPLHAINMGELGAHGLVEGTETAVSDVKPATGGKIVHVGDGEAESRRSWEGRSGDALISGGVNKVRNGLHRNSSNGTANFILEDEVEDEGDFLQAGVDGVVEGNGRAHLPASTSGIRDAIHRNRSASSRSSTASLESVSIINEDHGCAGHGKAGGDDDIVNLEAENNSEYLV